MAASMRSRSNASRLPSGRCNKTAFSIRGVVFFRYLICWGNSRAKKRRKPGLCSRSARSSESNTRIATASWQSTKPGNPRSETPPELVCTCRGSSPKSQRVMRSRSSVQFHAKRRARTIAELALQRAEPAAFPEYPPVAIDHAKIHPQVLRQPAKVPCVMRDQNACQTLKLRRQGVY